MTGSERSDIEPFPGLTPDEAGALASAATWITAAARVLRAQSFLDLADGLGEQLTEIRRIQALDARVSEKTS